MTAAAVAAAAHQLSPAKLLMEAVERKQQAVHAVQLINKLLIVT